MLNVALVLSSFSFRKCRRLDNMCVANLANLVEAETAIIAARVSGWVVRTYEYDSIDGAPYYWHTV